MEVLKGQQSIAQAAKEWNVHPNRINKWIVEFRARGHEIFERKQKENEDKKKIECFGRLLGQKELEIALLKNYFISWQTNRFFVEVIFGFHVFEDVDVLSGLYISSC